jgi:hypothetical protein
MAVTSASTARCCANLQIAINTDTAYAPDRTRLALGMLDGLRSPENRVGVDVRVATSAFSGTGGLDGVNDNTLEIVYDLPDCVAASQTAVDVCGDLTDEGDNRGYLSVTVEKVSARGGEFTLDEFDGICQTPNERLGIKLRQFARSIKKDIDTQLITAMVGCLSNYSDGTDSADVVGTATKTLNILNAAGYVNAGEWAKLKSEYRKQFAVQDAIIVGGDVLAQYEDVLQLGGKGPNAIGSGTVGLNPYFVDYQLDAGVAAAVGGASGPDSSFAISWLPGSAQFLDYQENVGYKEYFYPQNTRTTITIDGMVFDYWLRFEECPTPKWKWVLSKRYDLFCIPEAVYAPCFNSNGKLLWMLGCGDATCIAP